MRLLLSPHVIFFPDVLDYYASFENQIEDENPILLERLFDCVRWASIYPIAYSFEKQEFYGLFIPWRWDRLRGLKTNRIIFNVEGLNENFIVKDTRFEPCKFSELQRGG